MVLVWGKKYSYKLLGYVADFCPICRGPQAFRMRRTKLVPHFWYIPTGLGEFVCNERRCLACGVDFNGEPTRYASLSKKRGSFEQLKPLTFPNFDQVERGRMEVEAAVRKNPAMLPARDRYLLIRQPMELLSPRVENHWRATHIDREVGLTFVGAIAAVWAGAALATRFSPDNVDVVTLTLLALGVLAVFVQFLLTGRRYMRRQIAPLLVRCLAPLKPAPSEVERAVDEMKSGRHKIGAKLDVRDLLKQLDTARA